MDEDLVYDIIRNNNPDMPDYQVGLVTQGVLAGDPYYKQYSDEVKEHIDNTLGGQNSKSLPVLTPATLSLMAGVKPEPLSPERQEHYNVFYPGSTRSAYEAQSKTQIPRGSANIQEKRIVDMAIARGADPKLFANYGQPGNDDQKAITIYNMVKKDALNEYRQSQGNKDLLPMTWDESLAGLNLAANQAYENVSDTMYPVVKATKRYATQAKNYAQPMLSSATQAAKDYTNSAVQKTKQYTDPAVEKAKQLAAKSKNYIANETEAGKAYRDMYNDMDSAKQGLRMLRDETETGRIYRDLYNDPESTVEGLKLMANDASNYVTSGEAKKDLSEGAPRWVANISHGLNEGSKFFGSLKDAWKDPEYYMNGGTYEDKLEHQKAIEVPTMSQYKQQTGFRAASNETNTAPQVQQVKQISQKTSGYKLANPNPAHYASMWSDSSRRYTDPTTNRQSRYGFNTLNTQQQQRVMQAGPAGSEAAQKALEDEIHPGLLKHFLGSESTNDSMRRIGAAGKNVNSFTTAPTVQAATEPGQSIQIPQPRSRFTIIGDRIGNMWNKAFGSQPNQAIAAQPVKQIQQPKGNM